jgi:hypothetical protein
LRQSLRFYSIKEEGEPLARDLQSFYNKKFILFRKNKENKVIDYPYYFYDVLFDANECLCRRKQKSISWYNGSFYDMFIDEFQHTIISEKTFSFIWKCLRQSLFYQKDKFIFSAIDNLKLNSKEYTIISVNLNSYKFQEVLTKKQNSFKIPIIELDYTQIDTVNHSLFIMKNEDLPCIINNTVKNSKI